MGIHEALKEEFAKQKAEKEQRLNKPTTAELEYRKERKRRRKLAKSNKRRSNHGRKRS